MNIMPTRLPGVSLIAPTRHADDRGFFQEVWNLHSFADHGIVADFLQDNHSRSHRDVLRGLHHQVVAPQGKLVRVTRGAVFDVAIDIRPDSPTFARWTGHVLSEHNRLMMWVPPGFAHGFLSLEDDTDVLYKCTAIYAPAHERAILWNDPDIAIQWPLGGRTPRLSSKDAAASRLADRAEVMA